MPRRRIYYGWILVAVGVVCYGFGISPAYYSWGFYGPELRDELGLTAEQTGSVFGAFNFTFSVVGPLVGVAIARFGLRSVFTAGAIVAAAGFFLLSRAETLLQCYLSYALLGGIGIGFSTIIPGQALASYWFVRYRARAMAIIFTGGALVGMGVNPFNAAMLSHADWRSAWVVIAAVSVAVAVIAALFVRNDPSDLGLEPDGGTPATTSERSRAAAAASLLADSYWTAARAIRTPQFVIVTLAGVGYSLPWAVVSAHGALFIRDELGIAAATAAVILSTARVGASAFGRLSASASDFISPPRFLALALFVEGLGTAVLAVSRSPAALLLAVALLGLGFGAAYIAVPVVFAQFFGRRAFATTTGTRTMINAVFLYLAPTLAGRAADATGSYVLVFWMLAGLTVASALAAFVCRQPATPAVIPAAESTPAT
jgi:MFS family permease